jgi:hypothetical protein
MDRINTLNYQYLEQALTRGINDVEEGRVASGLEILKRLRASIPAAVPVPGTATAQAMDEIEAGQGKRFNRPEDLFEDLDL